MNLIAAVDKNWAIGCGGRLLVSIPSDRETFRRETVGRAVIMGRKTLESLPGGQPLAKRTNIVLSRDPDFRAKGAVVCRSVEEALAAADGFAAADGRFTGPFCRTATGRILLILIMLTRRILICVIWIWIRTGCLSQNPTSRHISICAIRSAGM